MSKGSIGVVRGPNVIHPEKASAVGSRNSLNRSGRDEYQESQSVVDEEVDKILNHISSKLPPEALEKLDVLGTIKPKLHNYYNQSMQNMLNRYLVTVEDELSKKYRDLIDNEEYRNLNRYTPRAISEILDKVGGMDKFNTGEIEKSIVNMFGHLHGSIQRGIFELEHQTNALLRQKTDVGAFVRGENAYAIVKCSFKDNKTKPKAVMDVKLAINILDSEFISPVHHYQESVLHLLKELISNHVHIMVEKEIENLNLSLLDEGKEELTNNELIFEKFKALDNYVEDDIENENSKRYSFVAKKFMDSIDGLGFEISPDEYDQLGVRENVKRIIDNENIRNRGFNTVVNLVTATLDTSRMGYQHIENFKNARRCIIREYEDTVLDTLPDELFNIDIEYYDQPQLLELRSAYDTQYNDFDAEIAKAEKVVEILYNQYKENSGVKDFNDVAGEYLNKNEAKKAKGKGWFGGGESDKEEAVEEEDYLNKTWNELNFIAPKPTMVEELNKTNINLTSTLKKKLVRMQEKVAEVFGYQYPPERRIVMKRLNFLENQFNNFAVKINPYHVQPGLVLEVNITSVKRKKTTMMGMANVLNEVLSGLSKGFGDKAFAAFSRRRSTERADIDEEFETLDSPLIEEGA